MGDPVVEPENRISTRLWLEFAGLPPTLVNCYPLSQQIAEKLHAYTRPNQRGESVRVKGLADLLLTAELGPLSGDHMTEALDATFTSRATHPLPAMLPSPPTSGEAPYRKLPAELELGYLALADASRALGVSLNPVMQQAVKGKSWQPSSWEWR